MNGYLVVLRHHLDDLPLLLTADIDEARRIAARVTEEDGGNEKNILRLDSSTPINVCIYTFLNGRLAKFEEVKNFAA